MVEKIGNVRVYKEQKSSTGKRKINCKYIMEDDDDLEIKIPFYYREEEGHWKDGVPVEDGKILLKDEEMERIIEEVKEALEELGYETNL